MTTAAATPQFAVTLGRRADSAGLRRMTLREAVSLLEFIALRGVPGARILPVDHSATCGCAYCGPDEEV